MSHLGKKEKKHLQKCIFPGGHLYHTKSDNFSCGVSFTLGPALVPISASYAGLPGETWPSSNFDGILSSVAETYGAR